MRCKRSWSTILDKKSSICCFNFKINKGKTYFSY